MNYFIMLAGMTYKLHVSGNICPEDGHGFEITKRYEANARTQAYLQLATSTERRPGPTA